MSEQRGRNCQAARVRRGWTQRELAEATAPTGERPLNWKTVQAVERGDDVLVSTLERLASALGISVDEYCGFEAPVPTPAATGTDD